MLHFTTLIENEEARKVELFIIELLTASSIRWRECLAESWATGQGIYPLPHGPGRHLGSLTGLRGITSSSQSRTTMKLIKQVLFFTVR